MPVSPRPIVPVHTIHPMPARPPLTHGPRPPRRDEPPEAHHRHRDYVFVEGYDWYPSWFPYWDERWYAYWHYLYDYYGGTAYAEYAEWARDEYLRSIAAQQGWL